MPAVATSTAHSLPAVLRLGRNHPIGRAAIAAVALVGLLAGCGTTHSTPTSSPSVAQQTTTGSAPAAPDTGASTPADQIATRLRSAGYTVTTSNASGTPSPLASYVATNGTLKLSVVVYATPEQATAEAQGFAHLAAQHAGKIRDTTRGATFYYSAGMSAIPRGSFDAAVTTASGA